MLLDERDLDLYRPRARRLADSRLGDARIDERGIVRGKRTAA